MSEEKPKPKPRAPRQKMSEQPLEERRKNFNEVPYGFSEEQAKIEADRCLQCKNPHCVMGCPVNIAIPDFLKLVAEGKFLEAAKKIKEQNMLPAICGRVCPQEEQCEILCILGKKCDPVSIGYLERFVADFERKSGKALLPDIAPSTGKKVAIVGSGPAGLAAAGDLIRLGHAVVVFEALHEVGGVLNYGIPEFRLPKDIVKSEVDFLKKLGVEFRLNTIIGKSITVDELLTEEGFLAVFIGAGAGLPKFMDIPGEDLVGVYSANEYLTRSNLMKAYKEEYDTPIIRGKKVAIIGGGNVAMDAARTAVRLGSENTFLVYRRSKKEMPAREDEIHHAEQEGIEFELLSLPLEILGDDKGKVRSLRCQKMKLGERDERGRRRPEPIPGSEFELEADIVIVAIGNAPNPLIAATTRDIKTQKSGGISVDPNTGRTSKPHVYAGGDIVSGAATVILAMGAGRRAAKAIHEDISNLS